MTRDEVFALLDQEKVARQQAEREAAAQVATATSSFQQFLAGFQQLSVATLQRMKKLGDSPSFLSPKSKKACYFS